MLWKKKKERKEIGFFSLWQNCLLICPLLFNGCPLSLKKKHSLSFGVEVWEPFQHKTSTMQFSLPRPTSFFASRHLLILLAASISFAHPLWLYQIAFISAQPWYAIEGQHHSAVSQLNVELAFSPYRPVGWCGISSGGYAEVLSSQKMLAGYLIDNIKLSYLMSLSCCQCVFC